MSQAARAPEGPSPAATSGLPAGRLERLGGWGRYPVAETSTYAPDTVDEILAYARGLQGWIPRGAGRSYGDAAVGEAATVDMRRLNRFRGFDPGTGLLDAEAGVTLSEVIDVFLPKGWFPYATPGTQFVTLGGAAAADVHGKNHHLEGGFGRSVTRMRLATPRDGVLTASPDQEPELFAATIGGMGLTGIMLDMQVRLRPVETGWIRQRTRVVKNLGEMLQVLGHDQATYSVAWIDCLARGASLGRGLVYLGEHAALAELDERASRDRFPSRRARRLRAPFEAPDVLLNPYSMRAFNELYFRKGALAADQEQLVGWEPYFYPLDGVLEWNLLYGKRGFLQHQCVIPWATAEGAIAEILDRVARRGIGSFLAVVKSLGTADGILSFPMEGVTLTLDFPMRDGLLDFLDELDQVVVGANGRIYLAKDARQAPSTFEAGYPALSRWRSLRRASGADQRIRSKLSQRLAL